jgi:hypothetical protein
VIVGGADLNHDGIDDTPYKIDNTNVDNYTLTRPVNIEKESFPAF